MSAAAPAPATVPSLTPVQATAAESADPSADLVLRAQQWQDGRTALFEANTDRALELAEQVETTTTAPPKTAAPAVEAEPESVVTTAPAPTAPPTTTAPPPPTTTAPPTTTQPPPPPPPPPVQPGEPTAAHWAALRQCESGGNYAAVNPSGQYRGAYQFSQATWDGVAAGNSPHLVGIDPAAAAPGDQDAMALALWRVSGSGPWPHCGHHLH